MKKFLPVIFFQAVLSVIAGVLLSKMSFLARTAIGVFKKKYAAYAFMKIWWQGALLFFVVLMILLALQRYFEQRMSIAKAALLHAFCMACALAGLYFTYADFRHDLSHRWAGERLHLGFYLFWVGWIVNSLFLIFRLRDKKLTDTNRTDAAGL